MRDAARIDTENQRISAAQDLQPKGNMLHYMADVPFVACTHP